jgi:folate-dependent tRNA-U54 methylase TrmFO/GidA
MADSVNHAVVFRQSRYGSIDEGDYLNCPMDKDTGKLLIAGPNLYVSVKKFQNILTSARSAGLFEIEYPQLH